MPGEQLNIGSILTQLGIDNKQFDKGIGASEGMVRKFTTTVGQASKQAAVSFAVITTASIMASKKLVDLASDATETNNKFKTAFKGIENQANSTAQSLANGYLLSRREAERLLSNTGDLLKGFGFTADSALELSNNVQELAADLTSYNNLQGGTARASEILTKAMLGERDSLVALGIKISEDDVKTELLARKQDKLSGTALLAAKAQITFELALRQSQDALGDVDRSIGTYASNVKQFEANIDNVSIALGNQLLPVVNGVLTELLKIDFTEAFGSDAAKDILNIGLGIGTIVGSLALVGGAVALVSNPMLQLVAVSALVVNAINENFAGLGTVFNSVKDTVVTVFEEFVKVMATMESKAKQQDIFAVDETIKRLEKLKSKTGIIQTADIQNIVSTFSGDEGLAADAQLVLFGDRDVSESRLVIQEIINLYSKGRKEVQSESEALTQELARLKAMKPGEIATEKAKEATSGMLEIAKSITSSTMDGLGLIGEQAKEMYISLFTSIAEGLGIGRDVINGAISSGGSGGSGIAGTRNRMITSDVVSTTGGSLETLLKEVEDVTLSSEELAEISTIVKEKQDELAASISSIGSEISKLAGIMESELLGAIGSIIGELSNIQSQTGIFGAGSPFAELGPALSTFTSAVSVLDSIANIFSISTETFDDAVKRFQATEGSTVLVISQNIKDNIRTQAELNNKIKSAFGITGNQAVALGLGDRGFTDVQDYKIVTAALTADLSTISTTLGTTANDLANTIGNALSESSTATFGKNLREAVYDNVREGLIKAFLANESFEALSKTITLALADETIDPFERIGIESQLIRIQKEGTAFIEVLDSLGLGFKELDDSTEKLAETTAEVNRNFANIPTGLKLAARVFEARNINVKPEIATAETSMVNQNAWIDSYLKENQKPTGINGSIDNNSNITVIIQGATGNTTDITRAAETGVTRALATNNMTKTGSRVMK